MFYKNYGILYLLNFKEKLWNTNQKNYKKIKLKSNLSFLMTNGKKQLNLLTKKTKEDSTFKDSEKAKHQEK